MKPKQFFVAFILSLVPIAATGCAHAKTGSATPATPAPTVPPNVSAVIATDHNPAGFFIASNSIFVGNFRGGTLQRIDPASNRIVSTLRVGGMFRVQQESTADNAAWTCTNVDGVLHRIDVATGTVTASVRPDSCDGGDQAVIDGNLWAAPGPDSHDLLVLDGKTGATKQKIPLGDGWWARPMKIENRVIVPGGKGTMSCAVDGSACTMLDLHLPWLLSAGGKLYQVLTTGNLIEIDPHSLTAVKTYQVPDHGDNPVSLTADDSGHLYYRPDGTTIYRLSLATGAVDKFLQLPWSEATTEMTWGFGSLWVTNFSNDTVWRVNTAA